MFWYSDKLPFSSALKLPGMLSISATNSLMIDDPIILRQSDILKHE